MKLAFWSISSRGRSRRFLSVGGVPRTGTENRRRKRSNLQSFESSISGLKPVRFMPNISNSDFFCSDKSCLFGWVLRQGSACVLYAVKDKRVTLSDGFRDSTNELYTIINQCACPGVRSRAMN